MKKQILSIFLTVALTAGLTGCGSTDAPSGSSEAQAEMPTISETEEPTTQSQGGITMNDILTTNGGTSRTSFMGGSQDAFCEAMGDAGKSVSDYLGNGERIVYINVMNRLSIDCDCDGHPSEPDMHDIGILASTDPVALDQACIDLVWVSEGNESFVNRVEEKNGLHTLENAETIGLGSRSYRLVNFHYWALGMVIGSVISVF